MRVTSKGQVTIPIEVREKLGILPHTEVAFEVHGNAARLIKVPSKKASERRQFSFAKAVPFHLSHRCTTPSRCRVFSSDSGYRMRTPTHPTNIWRWKTILAGSKPSLIFTRPWALDLSPQRVAKSCRRPFA